MSSNIHKKSRKTNGQLPRVFYRWHRRIGAAAALFVIWIVISGWLLNHTDSLGLTQHQMRSNLLAHWYGLHIDPPKTIFTTANHLLASTEDSFIIDDRIFTDIKVHPIGLAESSKLYAVASENFLMLFAQDGTLVDTLNSIDLPFPHISRLGSGCDGIAIQDQTQVFASGDGIDWQPCTENIEWSIAQPITQQQFERIKPLLIPAISAEKLVIDLHTGRFFGRFGPYVVDIIGGCLLALALSGLWLFFRLSNQNRHRHREKRHPKS